MNERIKKLASEFIVHERFSRYGESTEEDYYEFYPDELEEFVELIVSQCVFELMHESTKQSNAMIQDFSVTVTNSIKQHFGVNNA